MDGFVSAKKPDVYGFMAYISSDEMSSHINSLKQKATKKKPFSFERFSCVVIPIFKYLEYLKTEGEAGEMKRINTAIDQWFNIVS